LTSLPLAIQQRKRFIWAALFVAAFFLRLGLVHFLAGDLDGDSSGYLNLSRNLLREHVYSIQPAAPFDPSFARVPGYPLFIALTWAASGIDNLTAVRIAQAMIDTLTCVGVAALAGVWELDEKKKRTASLVAFALAALCPFTIRYVPTILAETLSTFLAVSLALAASRALLAQTLRRALAWWAVAGILGGLGALVRPDGLLFFCAAVATLIAAAVWPGLGLGLGQAQKQGAGAGRVSRKEGSDKRQTSAWKSMPSLAHVLSCGATAVLAFTVTFAPWPIRNAVVFHQFIPLQPKHQGLPNGFVPSGYYDWLRTWVDDQRYIKPFRWEVDYSQIAVDQIPARAFDSPEERAIVAQLLDRYNHPRANPAGTEINGSAPQTAAKDERSVGAPRVRMTSEIDSGFARIAEERRKRAPLRFYFWLPARRAVALWFDTHSDHYPFGGELFPLPDKSYFKDGSHSYLGYSGLWLFAALVWLYTLLGLRGAWKLWRATQPAARIFVVLVVLIMVSRLALFSTLDNPEPRFLVQFFPFLAVLGGIALAHLQVLERRKP